MIGPHIFKKRDATLLIRIPANQHGSELSNEILKIHSALARCTNVNILLSQEKFSQIYANLKVHNYFQGAITCVRRGRREGKCCLNIAVVSFIMDGP